MPYEIQQNHAACPASSPFAVVKKMDGKVMGCHATQVKANKQMQALHANEGVAGPETKPLAAQEDTAMSDPTLWQKVKAALGGDPTQRAAMDCPQCGSPDCTCGDLCTGKNCGCCGADPKMMASASSNATENALKHLVSDGAFLCGAPDGITASSAPDANCVDCVRKDSERVQAAFERLQVAAAAQREADAKAAADRLAAEQATAAAERAERVKAQTATFVKSLTNHGAAARAELESLYHAALSGTLTMRRVKAGAAADATDEEKYETVTAPISAEAGAIIVARLESLAKAIPPAGDARRLALGGAEAEQAARVAGGDEPADPHAAHFAALKALSAQGVSQSDPTWESKYATALAAEQKKLGVNRVAA